MIRLVLISVTMILTLSTTISGNQNQMLKESKSELDKIKNQLIEARQKADSLNQLESDLQKTISGYSESVNRNRKVINKTERQLASVRNELEHNNERLEDTERRLQTKRDRYVNLLLDYYRRKKSIADLDRWDFGSVMSQSRMVHYLASISGHTTREINQADDSIRLLAQHADSLTQTGSDLKRLRREKQAKVNLDLTLKEKEEASLGDVRRQSDLLQERVETLSEAARRMEEIIAELELAQQRRRQDGETPRYRAGSFTQLKGSLQPPIKGKIVSSFGWKKDKITNLSSFSPGIDIRPSKGHREVWACAPGRVVYVGQLRGYNNFVIIEHDDNFYTTYAGLGAVTVELDELLNTRDNVGSLAENKFHFEIRRGREHLDPVIWLDINEF
jgi:septal ring factor EnvC (AmiA/AmiB activator)